MDVLQIPFEFRTDLDFGRAAHNMPNEPPIDNPGTPGKVAKVMGEYKRGTLHSGSKHGPKVKSRKQALAIALNY